MNILVGSFDTCQGGPPVAPDSWITVRGIFVITIFVITFILVGAATPEYCRGETTWLPGQTVFPRGIADPHEPRFGLTWALESDQLDASVGAPFPIVSFPVAGHSFLAVVETSVFMRLGKEGSFFPLETVDGMFGLGIETSYRSFTGRLRLLHESAHKADGDSTVTYPGVTYSKEFWQLDLGVVLDRLFIYSRIGSAWHAVPDDPGLDLALGGTWRSPGKRGRALVSAHFEADSARSWKLTKSVIGGWETGTQRRFLLGIRLFDGNSPPGQYWTRSESYVGIEIQFTL
jgi:hypothetical protein